MDSCSVCSPQTLCVSVLKPLGFVSLKLHYTPKHTHRIQGCQCRNCQCFLCEPGSGLSFSHCIKRWRNNHVLTAKMQFLAYQDLTAVLSHVHLSGSSHWLQHSEPYSFQFVCFFPLLSLLFCRSLFFSSGQAGGCSDRYFSHSSNYSFCSDSASHTLWFIFTRWLQGIMDVLVPTVCVRI